MPMLWGCTGRYSEQGGTKGWGGGGGCQGLAPTAEQTQRHTDGCAWAQAMAGWSATQGRDQPRRGWCSTGLWHRRLARTHLEEQVVKPLPLKQAVGVVQPPCKRRRVGHTLRARRAGHTTQQHLAPTAPCQQVPGPWAGAHPMEQLYGNQACRREVRSALSTGTNLFFLQPCGCACVCSMSQHPATGHESQLLAASPQRLPGGQHAAVGAARVDVVL
jgi:hypothetical protein